MDYFLRDNLSEAATGTSPDDPPGMCVNIPYSSNKSHNSPKSKLLGKLSACANVILSSIILITSEINPGFVF